VWDKVYIEDFEYVCVCVCRMYRLKERESESMNKQSDGENVLSRKKKVREKLYAPSSKIGLSY